MKSKTVSTSLSVKTGHRSEMIEITDRVQHVISQSGVTSRGGFVIVYVPHTTAGVTINENADPDVKRDMLRKLDELVPNDESYYRHAEGNSDSHVKASMMGSSVTVIIDEDGQLLLGRWQGIYFCEFDGPRTREVVVKVVAGS